MVIGKLEDGVVLKNTGATATKSLRFFLADLLRDENGATAIEYGLIAALIAVAAIAAFQLVGTNLSTLFSTVATQL